MGGFTGGGELSPNNKIVLNKITPTTGDDQGISIDGQVSIGTWSSPNELIVGGGDSTIDTMVVLTTQDDISYTDQTVILQSDIGSTVAMFETTSAGNIFYFGADFPFAGIKIKYVSDGVMLPTDYVAEYYSGSWIAGAIMATNANSPYEQHGWAFGMNGHTSEQLRFNMDPSDILPNWQQNTINGITKYWGRIRLVNAITTAPVLEQIKLHTSRWECNADGRTEYFGLSRYPRTLDAGIIKLIPNTITGLADQSVTYESGVTVAGYNDNKFANNVVDSTLITQTIYKGLDTSIPLEYAISYYVAGTGTGIIDWEARVYTVSDGFVYDGTAVPTVLHVADTITTNSNLVRRSVKFYLDVSSLTDNDGILVNLRRDATPANTNDTLPHDVVLTNYTLTGWFWTP